jgi:hypothetical protein
VDEQHAPAQPTVADLIARSDLARLNPARARELLDRTADPLFEERNERPRRDAA